jgi:hypothetical protein
MRQLKLPRIQQSTVSVILFSILFYGCKKHDLPCNVEEQPCRVISMTAIDGDRAEFSYTSWGDPELIDVAQNRTANPDFYFKYDQNKRLIEFQAFHSKDLVFQELRKFYYEGNKIVKDSSFIGVSIDNLYAGGIQEGKYLYDKYDRIIEYNYIHYEPLDEITTKDTLRYNYPDESPYVDNRNYFAGNRVLMFVGKDYSRTTPAESYNDLGYPIRFSETQRHQLFCCSFNIKEIQYDCSEIGKTK